MPKTKTQWVCQNCGRTTAREMGKCPQCGEFNTMVEVVVAEPGKGAERRNIGAPASRPLKLSEIEGDAEARRQGRRHYAGIIFDLLFNLDARIGRGLLGQMRATSLI